MTRDLLIVSERALTASDLAAGVAAVHQGLPWQVTNEGDRLAVMHCEQPLLDIAPSVKQQDADGGRWRTELRTLADQAPLALDVARAVAWEIGGELVEIPD